MVRGVKRCRGFMDVAKGGGGLAASCKGVMRDACVMRIRRRICCIIMNTVSSPCSAQSRNKGQRGEEKTGGSSLPKPERAKDPTCSVQQFMRVHGKFTLIPEGVAGAG